MKKAVILIVVIAVAFGWVVAAMPPPVVGQDGVTYVDASATGANDGSSWDDAYVYLQDGLASAAADDEIWVADGAYYPDEGAGQDDGNRTSTFALVTDVAVYGGFAGDETAREQRDWAAHPAVLSGELEQGGNITYAYHVVTGADSATLDGFVITDGCADSCGKHARGGGLYNGGGALQVANCTFYDNYGMYGGGLYNGGVGLQVTNCAFEANRASTGGGMSNDLSSSTVDGCTFVGNRASNDGGGMYNEGSSPTVTGCTFRYNRAEYLSGNITCEGGGMYNSDSSPTVAHCTFEGNWASHKGGGMCNIDYSDPTVTYCTFQGNWASDDGGGMYNYNDSDPTVANCTLQGNWAGGGGGGMYNYSDSDPTVAICTFQGNYACHGGGMYNTYDSDPAVTGCTFQGNWASDDGSGMYNKNHSDPTVTNCSFEGNRAGYDGGGMHNSYESDPEVANCSFLENWAGDDGGGMYNGAYGSPTVANCSFLGNWAGDDGGGMYNVDYSSPEVTNCSLFGNRADEGGGMCNEGLSVPTVTNCILWGDCPDEIHDLAGSTVTYCDVQGGFAGDGNINADPLWVNPWSGDLHLTAGSPCIDAGNNTAPAIPALDFEGDDRIIDGDGNSTATVDMGVDELLLATVEVFFDSFEDCSLTNWVQDGQNDWFCSTQRAVDGTHSAEVDGWAKDATLTLKEAIDLSGALDATLTFSWFIEAGLDTGEYIALDLWDGTTWIEVVRLSGENWTAGHENMWHGGVVVLGDDYRIPDFKLRFRGSMSLYSEDANVDAVRIMATIAG